jgi:hypothetical protein
VRPKDWQGDIVFNIFKTSGLVRAFIALAMAGGAIAAAVPFATGATLSYTGSACSSFTVSGTAPNQTMTCVTSGGGAGGGGGGTTPTCAPTAKPSSPMIGQSTTITANCDGSPTSYVWTGTGCSGNTTSACTVTKSLAKTVTFSVQAANAAGMGSPATISVTWH